MFADAPPVSGVAPEHQRIFVDGIDELSLGSNQLSFFRGNGITAEDESW